MHVFDLFAVAEDRRIVREREGRLERIVRYAPAAPAVVKRAGAGRHLHLRLSRSAR